MSREKVTYLADVVAWLTVRNVIQIANIAIEQWDLLWMKEIENWKILCFMSMNIVISIIDWSVYLRWIKQQIFRIRYCVVHPKKLMSFELMCLLVKNVYLWICIRRSIHWNLPNKIRILENTKYLHTFILNSSYHIH